MTADLSAHQMEALRHYGELMAGQRSLFEGRAARPIVRDMATLERYAADENVVLGVMATTPYLWLVNDLVASRDVTGGEPVLHPYLRLIPPPALHGVEGVVVVATLRSPGGGEKLILVRQERHATGLQELEFPRGFGVRGAGAGADAVRELEEETGHTGAAVSILGTTVIDSGASAGLVSFVHVEVDDRVDAAPEVGEAIEGVLLMTREELWQAIDSGDMRDSFTLQGLSLYERRLGQVGS